MGGPRMGAPGEADVAHSEALPSEAQIPGYGTPGPQLREEVWEAEGGRGVEVVCPRRGELGGCQALEVSTEGIPRGTVSLRGRLGPMSSGSWTRVPIPPLPRWVPGLLWS